MNRNHHEVAAYMPQIGVSAGQIGVAGRKNEEGH
jgi:hypothetical protein